MLLKKIYPGMSQRYWGQDTSPIFVNYEKLVLYLSAFILSLFTLIYRHKMSFSVSNSRLSQHVT
jgi:hypothetical protein